MKLYILNRTFMKIIIEIQVYPHNLYNTISSRNRLYSLYLPYVRYSGKRDSLPKAVQIMERLIWNFSNC